jgi:hypothetical protein
VSDEPTPLNRALDLVVFAPLGLALTARDAFPELARKGRERVTNQLTAARMIGQFAVTMGRNEAGKLLSRARAAGAARVSPPERPAASPGAPARPAPAAARAATRAPADLAIPNYDTLSASQVIERLPGLSPEELEAIRRYEEAGRGRRTILHRVAQLQGAHPNGAG